MLHWFSKVTIILRKRKYGKETIIVRQMEYKREFKLVTNANKICLCTHT